MQLPNLPSVPTLDSFLALLPFNAKPAPAVTPFPPPAVVKPVHPTSFEISPFAEKVLVDPYKTIELAVLSKAELAIDEVVNYIDTVIPPELLNEIKGLPSLAEKLLAEGKSLEQYLNKLASSLPTNLSLNTLLRKVGIMDIANNLQSFVASVSSLGLSLESLPAEFTTKALTFMSDMNSLLDVSSFTNDFSSLANISGFGGSTPTSVDNPVADTAVAVAQISTAIDSPTSMINTLTSIGISNPANLLPLVQQVSSANFPIIVNGIKLVGADTAKGIVTEMNAIGVTKMISLINTLATDPSLTILADVKAHPQLAALLVSAPTQVMAITTDLTTYGIPAITDVSSIVKTNGLTNTLSMTAVINSYPIADVQTVLASVATLGVAGYITANGAGVYQPLLDLVTAYGITAVTTLANAIATVGNANINTVVNNIATIGDPGMQLLIQTANTTGVPSLTSVMTTLSNDFTAAAAALAPTATVSMKAILNIVTGINTLTVAGMIAFVTAMSTVDGTVLLNNIDTLANLTADQLTAITNQIASQEPYTTLVKAGINGMFLFYAVKKTCELAALAGNYAMVVNLLTNYTGYVSSDYRRYLITSLLAHYKTNADDTSLGAVAASAYFARGLSTIYAGWQDTVRNGEVIGLLSPWLTASKDAIELLIHCPDTALAAKIQQDNQYTLK